MCIVRKWQSWVSSPSFLDPKAFALDPRSVAASVAASLVYFHAWITACNSHTQLSTLTGKQTLLQPAAAVSCVYGHTAGMCLRVISSASAPHVEVRMPLPRGGWHGALCWVATPIWWGLERNANVTGCGQSLCLVWAMWLRNQWTVKSQF